jgi:hypothetical protein
MTVATFYPNAHPESVSCDGWAYQFYTAGSGKDWATIRSATGTYGSATSPDSPIVIVADNGTDKWGELSRLIFTFDTGSVLPDTVVVTAAALYAWGCGKSDSLGISPDIGIFTAAPASNTNIAAGDYDSLGTHLIGDKITYSSFSTTGFNRFGIDSHHLNLISLTGITKLGLKNFNYDASNIAPAWTSILMSHLNVYMADQGGGYRPYLEVTYATSTAYSQTFTAAIGLVPSIQSAVVHTGSCSQSFAVGIGLVPSITQAETYARTITASIGLVPSIDVSVNSNTYLCVASQNSGSIKTSSPTGATWTDCAKTAAGGEGSAYLAVFQNRLCTVKQDSPGFVYSNVTDITANWNKQTGLPSVNDSITDLFVFRDANDDPQLAILTHHGMYTLDVFDNFYLYPTDASWSHDKDSGKCAILGKNGLYIAIGKGILLQDGKVLTLYGPDLDDGMVDEQQGIVSDILNVGYWLVIAVDGGVTHKSGIYKRYLTQSHWHPVYVTSTTNSPIRSLFWEDGTLYFGEGTDVKSLPFSGTTDNVKHDSTYTYAATGDLITSWIYGDHETIPKVAHKIWITSENCNDDDYISVSYQRNESTLWMPLGSFTISPMPDALNFETNASGVEFYRMRFKFTFTRGATTTNSPKMTGWTLEYRTCPPVLWRWRFVVMAKTNDEFEGKNILDSLKQALVTNTLISFYPDGSKDGDSYLVTISNMPGQEKISERGMEGHYTVQVDQVV